MNYFHLTDKEYNFNNYLIVPLRRQDLMLIKQWRNEQMQVLRQSKPLTDEDQLNYYQSTILPSFNQEHPRLMLFSFLLQGRAIGYGGLTNMDWQHKRAEISYLLETGRSSEDDRERYTTDFSAFLQLMKQVAFQELSFNRLFTETYDIRPLHIATLEANQFYYEGRMRQHVWIQGKFVDALLHGCLAEGYDDVQR